MSEIHQKKQRIGLLQQSKASNHWTAFNAISSNFKTMNYEVGVSKPKPFTNISNYNFADGSGSLTQKESEVHVNNSSGLSYLPFKSVATKQLLAFHLVAYFQKVVEAATTPFKKDIGVNNQFVDFANNYGYLFTLAGDTYNNGSDTGDGFLLKNSIINNLKISCNPLAEDINNKLMLEGDWVGIEMLLNQYLSGTWVSIPTITPYNTTSLPMKVDFSIGDVSLTNTCYRMFELNLMNNVKSDCITDKPNNYKLKPSQEITLDLPYTASSYKTLKSYKDGDLANIKFYNGDGTTDGLISINFTKCILIEPPFEVKDEYVALRIRARALEPTAGWGGSEVVMADTIDHGF